MLDLERPSGSGVAALKMHWHFSPGLQSAIPDLLGRESIHAVE